LQLDFKDARGKANGGVAAGGAPAQGRRAGGQGDDIQLGDGGHRRILGRHLSHMDSCVRQKQLNNKRLPGARLPGR
jgi:hypothetical protein